MATRKTHRRPYARFLKWFGWLMVPYLGLTAVLSLTVDPWRANNTPLSIAALDSSREIGKDLRLGKAALADHGDWETLILGSSRMEIGFSPSHPVFAGQKTANLSMSAATLFETVPVGHYTLDRNPRLKTLLFGIEPGDLHNDFDSRTFTNFNQSPFAGGSLSIERDINQVIGGRSLAACVSTLRTHMAGGQVSRSPLGQWLTPNHPADLRAYSRAIVEMGFEYNDDKWETTAPILREDKAAILREFLLRVRKQGVRMIVIIPPQHALKQIHPVLDSPNGMCWETDLRTLAEICRATNEIPLPGPPISLWSFLAFDEPTTRPLPASGAEPGQMPGWYDLGHFQESIGNLVLDTIFAGEPGSDPSSPTIGIDLLAKDWESIRSDWISAHRAYCGQRQEDVAWWRSVFATATDKKIASRPNAEKAH